MSAESKKTSSSIRTYAQDLAIVREKRGLIANVIEEIAQPDIPSVSRQAAAPAPSYKVAPRVISATTNTPLPKPQALMESPELEQQTATTLTTPLSAQEKKPIMIPAFHELHSKQKHSSGSHSSPVPNESDSDTVTETKIQESGFLVSLFKKIGSLFSTPKKAQPTITKNTLSAGTPQETSPVLTIKRQIQKEPESTFEEHRETSWSPYTESGFNLLESPEAVPAQITTPPQPPIPAEPEPEPEPEPTINPTVQKIKTHAEPVRLHGKLPKPTPPTRSSGAGLIDRLDTNTLTIVLVVVVIGTITLALATKFIFERITYNSPSTVATTELHSIISPTNTLVTITLTATSTNHLAARITEATKNLPVNGGEIAISAPTGEELSSSYLFELLKFSTSPSFRQAITSIRFVTSDQSTPVSILSFTDSDTVRGGLLQWETTLGADFSDLFNYNNSEATNSKFVDDNIAGIDVRVLSTSTGASVVYGIVNTHNVVIIAPNTEIFAQILTTNFAN